MFLPLILYSGKSVILLTEKWLIPTLSIKQHNFERIGIEVMITFVRIFS